jgi:AmiR/NasT family two-component response regulator
MSTVLLCPDDPKLRAELPPLGLTILGACAPAELLREAARLEPDVLICAEAHPARRLLDALEDLARHVPLPVLLFTSDPDVQTMERALRGGVHAYVVNGYAGARLRSLVQLAKARFRCEREQRAAYEELVARFEERKLVDRAKGILMRARRLGEDEAFERLRAAAMQDMVRIGQVAQRLIDAQHDAEAVNHAGRLRMLSQRVVHQFALQCAGVDAAAALQRREAAERDVEQHLGTLARTLSKPTFGDLLDPTVAAWKSLRELLLLTPRSARLAEVDAAAERLLGAAEALTTALEAASPLATLAIVNRAGRQRMLCQRLAKQALVAGLCEGATAQAAASDGLRTIEAFEAALARLNEAPLSSEAIRADLAAAGSTWATMRAGVLESAQERGQRAIAQAADELLAIFERLTHHYMEGARELLDVA